MTGIELDYETHTYRLGSEPIPGVSEIITSLGLIERSFFDDWSRERGTAVHQAIEYVLSGGVEPSSLDPRIEGYVAAAVRYLKDAEIVAGPHTHVERPVWHAVQRYAGTPDLVTVAFGRDSIVDWKSGEVGIAGLTTAFYELAARICFPAEKPRARVAVQLFPDGKYKQHPQQDGFDYPRAASAASLFNAYIWPRKLAAMKAARSVA